MCEQTEINYLDGDVVWVKLGSSWWPGQVVHFEKLPEDVQLEFTNKPLIAAVKFFQEESFEFVKNYQQIYKYNCTQKDDFIKKGLDKYRAKIKDGSNYMDKFPQDVKTAETLTDGNPNILLSEKFNPEQKPDISGLFGDKKIFKRKRTRDDSMKQIHGDIRKRVTHPRFLKENDHEIRIRQQPKHLPLSTSTTNSTGGIFPCQVCGFTATRVNVIICHLKSHRLNNETTVTVKSKVKMNTQPKSKQTISDFPKRKSVKKSVPAKIKSETKVESIKRKYFKQIEKPNKKKKSDPQLREKLLADWSVDSDEEEIQDVPKSLDKNSSNLLIKNQPNVENSTNTDIFVEDSSKDNTDTSNLLHESSKLLDETDNFVSKNFKKSENDENDLEKVSTVLSPKNIQDNFQFKKHTFENFTLENDSKNSRLSCFDFDEEDNPEPSISSVRKITRGLGSKSMSIKKEIIKEFEMSQALKSDAGKDMKIVDNMKLNVTKNLKDFTEHMDGKILNTKDSKSNKAEETNDKTEKNKRKIDNNLEICETQVEIVEIFEEHREDEMKYDKVKDNNKQFTENSNYQSDNKTATENQSSFDGVTISSNNVKEPENQQSSCTTKNHEMISSIFKIENSTVKIENEPVPLANFIFESRDETSSDNTLNNKCVAKDLSENSASCSQNEDDLNFCIKKRRGRPKKNLTSTDEIAISEHLKMDKIDIGEFDVKTSESESDFFRTERKLNIKYESSINLQSFDHKSFKTDIRLSESDDKLEKMSVKPKKDRKFKSDFDGPVDDSIKNIKKIKSGCSESISKHSSEIKELAADTKITLKTKNASKSSNNSYLKEQSKVIERKINEEQSSNDIELLPPKKSQIKKFGRSLIDSNDNSFGTDSFTIIKKSSMDVQDSAKTSFTKTSNETLLLEEKTHENPLEINVDFTCKKIVTEINTTSKSTLISDKSENLSKLYQTEKCASATTLKIDDTIIKTAQIEPALKIKKKDDCSLPNFDIFNACCATNEIKLDSGSKSSMLETIITNYSEETNFKNIEVIADNTEIEVKTNDQVLSLQNDKSGIHFPNDLLDIEKNSSVGSVSLSTKNSMEPFNFTSTAPLPEIKIAVPVKKREKPRIIENVALKEPMILKTKLIEKHPAKFRKHKLESDDIKLNDLRSSNTKVMKIETVLSNNKNNLSLSCNQSFVAKKILKVENISSINDMRNETITNASQTLLKVAPTEKFIQQSSQSLVDMELDINSMPFVLSEDILTPESIEQMPVVISSVLPTTPITSTLSTTLVTPTKQIGSASQLLESPLELNDINLKKKSGTPTILKSKNKAKPTITSIKNVVPPLTSAAYKGSFKVNAQASKTALDNQKIPGKYVIVQTSGHQQPYSTHQKIEIPTSKSSGSAQIVQQGSKVVILTSPTSGQSNQKVLPLNSISKALTNKKVQRIVTPKQGQTISSASSQSLVGSKTVLTSKSGESNISSNGTKLTGQKIIGHQQIIAPKSVLTQLSGAITKPTAMSNIPQGIITKESIFTPITTSTIGGKTFISSKTLVAKGFPSQSCTSKHILSPVTQTLTGKTILNSQGIVSKGTVLTPITGSQVKALAAKNIKGNKIQYQSVQHKIQLIETQKSAKVPISSTQAQSSNMVALQNTDLKTVIPAKKLKQTVNKQATVAGISPSSSIVTVQQKGKIVSLSPEQKHGGTKMISRMVKMPTRVVKDKIVENVQHKQLADKETLPLNIKIEQEKQIASTPIMKSAKIVTKNLQKKTSSVTTLPMSTLSNSGASLSIAIPSLEQYSLEKIPKKEMSQQAGVPGTPTVMMNEIEKIDIQKIPSQAQIMALPTENCDGTQSIVLFTVDEQGQGHIIPLDNNALVSLDGTSTMDGNRTIYIDSSSLEESGNINNIVLEIDNNSLPSFQPTSSSELTPAVITETLPTPEILQGTNQDILATAIANTDFQHDIGVPETTGTTTMTSFTQTSLINQTILQSTIIPPTEPISSASVLETSLTLNQPIMTPLEVPSSMSPQSDMAPVSSTTSVPLSLKIPISINSDVSAVDETLSTSSEKKTIDETLSTSSEKKTIDESLSTSSEKKTIDETLSTSEKKTIDMRVESSTTETESKLVANTHYSISISGNNFSNKQSQITPSMPLIDDSFNANNGFDSTNTSVITEDSLRNFVTKTSEELIKDLTGNDSLQENNETLYPKTTTVNDLSTYSSIEKNRLKGLQTPNEMQDASISSQNNVAVDIETCEETGISESIECANVLNCKILNNDTKFNVEMSTTSTESPNEVQSSHKVEEFNISDQGVEKALVVTESIIEYKEETSSSNQDLSCEFQSMIPLTEKCDSEVVINSEEQKFVEVVEQSTSTCQISDSVQRNESICIITKDSKITFENDEIETSQETPSQSYKQPTSNPSDVLEAPSQSVKSENSQEATQLLTHETMEIDKNVIMGDPPTQSYQDAKMNKVSQFPKILSEISTNAPTQSFNEMIEINTERESMDESMDDPNFPTQSYEVRKLENCIENLEIDIEISQAGNIPSQSNDIGVDGIGTSSMSTNNSGLNEDETASSSYVPETPENQERDQDQESAISTSSYEIPPCEELNIASSSVIPDTSVQSEHSSIHDNGIPEIPTSSYNLNPDSSSAHVDTVPTSSYEDQIIIEQNVSTSHEVSISLASIEKTGSQSYVTDSSDERNEATSYYEHSQEVTESYYQNICKQSHSQLESHSEEEATPSYYETNPSNITSEASGSYFNQEEATPSYSNHEISASYYNPQADEASQSYYSSHNLNTSNQSAALQNVEATQSFYNENSNEQQFRQQGEATPTYTDHYPVDYAPVSSPLDRHDLVESSMPAKSMDR